MRRNPYFNPTLAYRSRQPARAAAGQQRGGRAHRPTTDAAVAVGAWRTGLHADAAAFAS